MRALPDFPQTPSLETVRALVSADWAAVNRLIVQRLGSDVALVNQVAHHIVHGGGKRLRPLTVLLVAKACGYEGEDHIAAAAIVEFIHTATLLHDDVVDHSGLRRGQETANAVFGNQASVLVGDFLYSRAFQMMVEIGELRILGVLAEATNTIAEGEVLQLMNCNNPDLTEADYLEVIYRKTAKLFEAGTRIGAILAGLDTPGEQALVAYGRHLGSAFQLVDDALDYPAANVAMGKPPLADASEGKITLPLILTLKRCTAAERDEIGAVLKARVADRAGAAPSGLAWIADCVARHRGVEQTLARADVLVRRARQRIEPFADSEAKQSLIDLTEFIVRRRS
jgi:octaprenyl-diphosphate synthase